MEESSSINETRITQNIPFPTIFKEQVEAKGLMCGTRDAIQRSGGHLSSLKTPETQQAINDKPIILLMTHNYSYEVLSAIAGLTGPGNNPRTDVKLISEASPQPSWFDQYVFPLHNVDRNPQGLLKNISRKLHPKEQIAKEKATVLNFKSIMSAADHFARGGITVMCPEGTNAKKSEWQIGVSALVKAAKHKLKDREGYIVFCDVKGISLKNYLAGKAASLIPSLSPYSKVTARYSEPIPVSQINTEGRSSREITENIETKYRSWIKQ